MCGYQAERFIYHLAPTYTLNVPVVLSQYLLKKANNFHGHNELIDTDKLAFTLRKRHINEVIEREKVTLPPFMNVGCNKLV